MGSVVVRVGDRVQKDGRTGTVLAVHTFIGWITVKWDDGEPASTRGLESVPAGALTAPP
jgi:hypothetical protein